MPSTAPLTLRDILSLPQLHGCRVLAGGARLDRAVSGVNLTDLSDYADWLSPGEFLVTTCFSLKDDRAAQEAFIPTLARRRLAGVGIKPHRFLDDIPPFMVRAAEELGLPLIELPMEAQFREIAWAVFGALRTRSDTSPLQIENPELLSYLRHLFLDPVTDEAAEQERGRYLNCDLTGPFCAARLQLLPAEAEGESPTPAQTYFLYRDFLSMLRASSLSCAAAVDGPQLLLVLSSPRAFPAPGALEQLLRTTLETLSAGYPELRFLLGWSRPGRGTAGMRRCCTEARAAVRACAGEGERPLCARCFSQLGLTRLLTAPAPAEEAALLSAELLGPLAAAEGKNAELLATLECYLQCLGNVKRVSEVLHTHYNTVAYRLHQIETLTGLDPRAPDGRFQLELALRLRGALERV